MVIVIAIVLEDKVSCNLSRTFDVKRYDDERFPIGHIAESGCTRGLKQHSGSIALKSVRLDFNHDMH